ncbi:TadE/TadG family type IV pilus assembly protein [Methylopila sp. M107]|uniref:TadE/TadG family type IV pilus assembly protein n=1 Tax=Methylopila sp. M107 TaxID=1101190 RepID=UPI00036B0B8E|nr:TadE/TadG family type IV pilus assembly protein [Methylopila sp. M107]
MDSRSPLRAFRPGHALRRFRRAESGAAAPLLGLCFLILIGCIGIAIDTGRSMVVKARLTNALDAAGLAVGARLATTDYTADAKNFVAANFKANYANATVTDVTATANTDKSVITLAATAAMPTAFMQLFGIKSVTVNAASEVTRASAGLELVMVLDNTGSMLASMPSLKSAANSLVSILFGDAATVKNLYVGLVPFSQTVNVGSSRTSWVTASSLAAKPAWSLGWNGCIEERYDGLDQTDDAPTSSDTKTQFAANYYAVCPQAITPMTNVKATVETGITNMVASGSTLINVGAVWGWRLISPTWRGLWGGTMNANSLPLDYGTKFMTKAVVLMTDGDNDLAGGSYTAYGYVNEKRLGTNSVSKAEAEADRRLGVVCSNMKAKGVYVYTVAFRNPSSDTKKLLETCATSTSYYFDAGDAAALKSAFQTIGGSLSKLRLSR